MLVKYVTRRNGDMRKCRSAEDSPKTVRKHVGGKQQRLKQLKESAATGLQANKSLLFYSEEEELRGNNNMTNM